MGNARGEEPDIAGTNIIHISRTILVDRGNPHAALEHQRPLVGRVPVELTVSIGAQSHVDTGHFRGGGQDVLVLLTRPAGARVGAGAVVREAKRPHGVGNIAAVGARRGIEIRVELLVVVGTRAGVGGAIASPLRLGGLDAVEVEVQPQLPVCGLAVHKLWVLDDG